METREDTYAGGVPWWATLLRGIFAVIIGLMLLGVGNITSAQGLVVVVQVLAWYWFFSGVLSLGLMFADTRMWGWKLFIGIMGILAGVYMINYPAFAAFLVPVTVVLLLGIQGILIGIAEIVAAFQGRGWGAGILGVLSIVLGMWLLAERYVAALALPWLAGVLALVGGIAAIIMAFQARTEYTHHARPVAGM